MTLKVGYLGFEVSDLAAWERFAGLVGLGTANHGDVTCLLVDNNARRLQLVAGARDDLVYMGWEAADLAEFDAVRARLDAAGVTWAEGDAPGAARLASNATSRSRTRTACRSRSLSGLSASPRRRSSLVPAGFVTGDQGLGHIAAA
ncbi:MAG: hypothetical protein IPM80_05610 [Proteobacteria bacterium]|nr:hypothetical protein [Pseudomonadota bacterium]